MWQQASRLCALCMQEWGSWTGFVVHAANTIESSVVETSALQRHKPTLKDHLLFAYFHFAPHWKLFTNADLLHFRNCLVWLEICFYCTPEQLYIILKAKTIGWIIDKLKRQEMILQFLSTNAKHNVTLASHFWGFAASVFRWKKTEFLLVNQSGHLQADKPVGKLALFVS